MPPTDAELLRRFVEESRDDAFTELVGRRIDLVYAAAMRQAGGDAHRAKDIAQHVFIDLARKARSLCRHSSLIGWLYTSTHYAAVNAVRTEQRRRRREEEAHAMDDITRPAAAEADWEQLRPELDAAMHELKERERQLVLLRFFDRQSFAAIAEELGLTENAAQKGVERALDKLHGVLARRGITSTAAALSLVIASQAVVAAPAELAANIAGISLAASTAGASAGSALGAFFVMSKIKTGIAAAIAIAVIVPAVVELRANRALSTELGALLAGPTDVRRLQQESERLNTALATSVRGDPDFDELARLRKRVAQLEARPPGVIDADLKPAKMWRNAGRATAAAANETFHWALFTGDVATVTGLITFGDDTPENRAAFMAKLSPAVRARYPTPELVVAAAFFGAGAGLPQHHHPDDAFQVIAVRPDDRPGMTDVRIWYSLASGREWRGGGRWLSTPNGFVLDPLSLTKTIDAAIARFDPATGDLRPRPPMEIDPRTGRPISVKK